MTDRKRIEEFEERTGLTFDPEGPDLDECEGCQEDMQFVPDHECGYTRSLNGEARGYEESMHGWSEEFGYD